MDEVKYHTWLMLIKQNIYIVQGNIQSALMSQRVMI